MNRLITSMLLLITCLVAGPSYAEAPEKVTVAYFQEWPTANQVAQAEKWYEKEFGVPVEWRPYRDGTEMAAAMVAGEVDISFSMGVVPFALAVTNGAPIKTVGVAVSYSENDNCVIYKKEAIDRVTAHQLEGRKVGVPLNTVTHYKMLRILDALAVNIDKVNVIDMSPQDVEGAFLRGELAMGCSWGGPLRRMKGHGWELMSAYEQERLDIRVFDIIAVTNGFAAKYPELVTKFLEVTDKSIEYLEDNPEAAKQAISEAAGMELKKSNIVLSLFDFYQRSDQLTERWMLGGVQTFVKGVADFFQAQGKIDNTLEDYNSSVDASFYEKVGQN